MRALRMARRLFFVEWIFYSTCRRYLNQVEELTKIYIQRRLNRKFSSRKYHQDDNQPDLYRFNLVAKTLTDSTEIYVPRVTLTVVKIIEPKGFLGTRGQSPIEKVQVVRRQSVKIPQLSHWWKEFSWGCKGLKLVRRRERSLKRQKNEESVNENVQ